MYANSTEIQQEKLYDESINIILRSGSNIGAFINSENYNLVRDDKASIFMDALWNISLYTSQLTEFEFSRIINQIYSEVSLVEKLRIHVICEKRKNYFFKDKKTKLSKEILVQIENLKPDSKLIYFLLTYRKHFKEKEFNSVYENIYLFHDKERSFFEDAFYLVNPKDDLERVKRLVGFNPDLSKYKNGKYKESVKIYMLCRIKRIYPCRVIIKDINNRLVLDKDGFPWTIPTLGASRFERPFNEYRGDTPFGVHTMDSVMPEADKQLVFGKFRRIILKFIPKSTNENNHKYFLPEDLLKENWWKQSVVARDIGRWGLRIHGTGLPNLNTNSLYYPLTMASGCVTVREGKQMPLNTDFIDQRLLLDQIMRALNILPRYKNETKIRGVLYVVPIDDQTKGVGLREVLELIDFNIASK